MTSTSQTDGLQKLVLLCPFRSVEYGRNLEVPPCVVVILLGVWIVDGGKSQSQKDDYRFLHCDLLLALAIFKKKYKPKPTLYYFYSSVGRITYASVVM